MEQTPRPESRTDLRLHLRGRGPVRSALLAMLERPLERALALAELQRIYGALPPSSHPRAFTQQTLREMDVRIDLDEQELREVPEQGGLLVVANHPFGAIEGLVIGEILARVRPDAKILANHLLGRIGELRDWLICVDPFGGGEAKSRNLAPLREALAWLRAGHALIVFPAGEVSSLHLRERRVRDPEWSPTVARLARRAGVDVVPMFFAGRNTAFFQLAGVVHPRLRTVLLPKQLANKRGANIEVRVGARIGAEKLAAFSDEREMLDYMRFRTYALERQGEEAATSPLRGTLRLLRRSEAPEALASAVDARHLEAELGALPPAQALCTSGALQVYHLRAAQAPGLLQEIGRLRELSFRANKEGTGRALDLDRFDEYYEHVVLWNRESRELVGAYRVAEVRAVLENHGPSGLYTNSLFRFEEEFLNRLGGALELGRSFVRPEQQRSFSPLLMLWRGIATYVARREGLHTLFGAVSINADYQARSRELIVHHLLAKCSLSELVGQARARRPLRFRRRGMEELRRAALLLPDVEELSAAVSDMERDRKGLPVLLREYLRLGGRVLDFNVDPEFSSVLDALVAVDLRRTPQHLLERYMGAEVCAQFFQQHGVAVDSRPRRERRRPTGPGEVPVSA